MYLGVIEMNSDELYLLQKSEKANDTRKRIQKNGRKTIVSIKDNRNQNNLNSILDIIESVCLLN